MPEIYWVIFLVVAIIAFAIVFLYYFYFLLPFSFKLKDPQVASTEALSVVICARNEKERLLENIPAILNQDCPDFQLVLVDDCSEDETWEVMKAFEQRDKRVKLVRVNENDQFYTSKKYALTLGIKAADRDLIVFTDADCKPESEQWLKELSSSATEGKNIVLAYGDYEPKVGILNSLIRFDTFLIASQYASFARRGIVYMGVGRNMAYRKSMFLESKGFSKHQHIDSGDDDLFIGQIAKSHSTAVNMSASAKTWSEPKQKLLSWIRQKGRHLTTFSHYKPKNMIFVGALSLAQALSFSLGIFLLFGPYYYISAVLLALKGVILSISLYKLKQEHRIPGFVLIPLIWELMLYALYPAFIISSKVYKRGTWKI